MNNNTESGGRYNYNRQKKNSRYNNKYGHEKKWPAERFSLREITYKKYPDTIANEKGKKLG